VDIFAWRYGHIPDADNLDQRPITELDCVDIPSTLLRQLGT